MRSSKAIIQGRLSLSKYKETLAVVRGSGEGLGTRLKRESGWKPDDSTAIGNHESGFNALPGGHRGYDANHLYVEMGTRGAWWSRSSDGKYSWRRALLYNQSGIDRDLATRTLGFSVRCVKD